MIVILDDDIDGPDSAYIHKEVADDFNEDDYLEMRKALGDYPSGRYAPAMAIFVRSDGSVRVQDCSDNDLQEIKTK